MAMDMGDMAKKVQQTLDDGQNARAAREELQVRCPLGTNFQDVRSDAVLAMAEHFPLASNNHGLIIRSEVVTDEEHLRNLIGDRESVDVELRAVDLEQQDAADISGYLIRFR